MFRLHERVYSFQSKIVDSKLLYFIYDEKGKKNPRKKYNEINEVTQLLNT